VGFSCPKSHLLFGSYGQKIDFNENILNALTDKCRNDMVLVKNLLAKPILRRK